MTFVDISDFSNECRVLLNYLSAFSIKGHVIHKY